VDCVNKEKENQSVEIYTDGACSGNPGPGGWGVLLRYGTHEKELNGGEVETTNNRMELKAAIEGLAALKEGCQVTVTTDSSYVRNGMTQWVPTWQKNNWITSSKKPVKNKDLWLALLEQAARHEIEWRWVKGHSGHPDNERADELARKAADKVKAELE